jgi:hypothetical protein
MSHENPNPQNQDPNNAERAVLDDYKDAYEAVESAVFLGNSPRDYESPTDAIGARIVNGRMVESFKEQPHIELRPVSGGDLIDRVPADERGDLTALGIGVSSEVAISFARDCDERDPLDPSSFDYRPGSVVVSVTAPFAQGEKVRLLTRTFGVDLDQSNETARARGNYGVFFETYEQKLDVYGSTEQDLDAPIEGVAPATVATEGIKSTITKEEGDKRVNYEKVSPADLIGRKYLKPEETTAITTVAKYF